MDVCPISKDKIKNPLYIGVGCTRPCSYQLRAVYVNEKSMGMDDYLYLDIDRKNDDGEGGKIVTIITDDEIGSK